VVPSENIAIHYIELDELETYKETMEQENILLPDIHTPEKDTKEFMILMNSKIEFVKRAIEQNPFQSTHFAWIDFSISHVFKQTESSIAFLKELGKRTLRTKCLLFPGCWQKGYQYDRVWDAIHWRFCGGFFLGDKESLLQFEQVYRQNYRQIIQRKQTLLWEVNIWTILEEEYEWTPTWFHADHNDTIVRIPAQYYLA
jgi:hypothetical protein